jgi:hypothetical protein
VAHPQCCTTTTSIVIQQSHPYKKTLYPLSCHSLLPRLWKVLIWFWLLWICLFWAFGVKGIVQHTTFLCLASNFYHTVFKIHPHCSTYQSFIPLYVSIILHCEYYNNLFVHSLGRHWVWSTLAIMNSVSRNVFVGVFVWLLVISYLGSKPYVILCLELPNYFPQQLYHVTHQQNL